MLGTGAANTLPIRVVDDEKLAQALVKQYDRELQEKLAVAKVAVPSGPVAPSLLEKPSQPLPMSLVGTFADILRGEFGVARVFHAFHVVDSGEPSRIVAPPPGQLS